jgi:hypothetical protein
VNSRTPRRSSNTSSSRHFGTIGDRSPVADPRPSNLEHRNASVVVLTFEQIEALLGFALPMPARTEREWWTDVVDTQGHHCATWTGVGRTAAPNFAAGIITFERPV